jgi:hypothetical protein
MALTVNGVSPGDLMTTEQPAAKAAPAFLVIIAAGKFHLMLVSGLPHNSGCQVLTV